MIKVAVVDNNESYLRRLENYWSRTYGSSALIVCICSSKEQLETLLEKERTDIILMNPQMDIDPETLPKKPLKLYLMAGKQNGEINGIPALAKNGNADELYRKMLDLYEQHMNIEKQIMPGQLVVFTSAQGGVGTTSTAIGYGKYLAKRGKRVVYLNFETVGDVSKVLSGQSGKNLGDLFYLCETNRKNINYSMEALLSKDESGLLYISPCVNPVELMEKSKEDILSVIKTVTEKGAFDVVILDRGFYLDEIGISLMKQADRIVLTAMSNTSGKGKLEPTLMLLEELENRDLSTRRKLKVLFNKSAREDTNADLYIGSIPFINAGDQKRITDEMQEFSHFEEILA